MQNRITIGETYLIRALNQRWKAKGITFSSVFGSRAAPYWLSDQIAHVPTMSHIPCEGTHKVSSYAKVNSIEAKKSCRKPSNGKVSGQHSSASEKMKPVLLTMLPTAVLVRRKGRMSCSSPQMEKPGRHSTRYRRLESPLPADHVMTLIPPCLVSPCGIRMVSCRCQLLPG